MSTKMTLPNTNIARPSNGGTQFDTLYVNIATNTGLSLSILLLCFHLIMFSFIDDFRNLPGKNLASFCAALLLEYTSTLISGVLEGTACYVNEIAAYYFIMASAFWMLTMSFDIWQILRSSTELTMAGNKQHRFIIYSLWSWLMPAVLTILVFFVLPRLIEDFDLAFSDFDRKKCTFVETDMMYIFVTSVFGTILLLNTCFFASSVYYIFSTQSAVNKRSTKNTAFVKHFSLYGRLSIIMGVTWTAEFITYYSNFDILSVNFKIINTFEGVFIVLAFTCRKEVLHYIKAFHIPKNFQSTPFYYYVSLRRM